MDRLFVFAVFVVCVAGCRSDANLPETKRRGIVIVNALNQYKSENEKYPTALNDLCPKYLSEIPNPTWGLKTWIYQPDDSEFELGVNETKYTGDGDSRWFRYWGEKYGWQVGD